MIPYPPQSHHLSTLLHLPEPINLHFPTNFPLFSTTTPSIRLHLRPLSSSLHQQTTTSNNDDDYTQRKHNHKTTALLLRHQQPPENQETQMSKIQKDNILKQPLLENQETQLSKPKKDNIFELPSLENHETQMSKHEKDNILKQPLLKNQEIQMSELKKDNLLELQLPQLEAQECQMSKKYNILELPSLENQAPLMSKLEKDKILELSLGRKRTPQFPGSIYAQSPSDPDVNSSLPSLKPLFDSDGDDGYDEEMIMKAIEIRRKVTKEIFMEAMKKGKFGITYSTNLVSRLTEFIDFVMIRAAYMKQLPEYSGSSFNVRAKDFINECNVVPLVRWLKHNELSYNQIGKLICMSKGNLDSVRNLAEWLQTIYVRGRFIGAVLTRAKGNIFSRSFEEFEENVEYLESKGVRREWMGYVVGHCPEVLSFTMEELKSRVEYYMNMGMDEEDFGTMVFDFPKVLGFFPMEEMHQKVL
ncbi:hypothetical protein Leryth_003516 [Lithospermum erythrorhizon]|nr:hypothetical protein Leryth_003516 [Lithospermum erythrorhizon]